MMYTWHDGCSICGDDTTTIHWDTPYGGTCAAESCDQHSEMIEALRFTGGPNSVDGPLWRDKERKEYRREHGHYDGYGVGVYRDTNDDNESLGYYIDVHAKTGQDVAELMRQAISAAHGNTDPDTYPVWERGANYEITETRQRK